MSSSKATYKFLPPQLADRLAGYSLSVRRPVAGGRQGLHRSPHRGSSLEFAEYREYIPGDSPNLIDWAVYARSDRYVIRQFQEETNLRAYILLDISASLDYREDGSCTKMEYACFLAAGLMYLLIRQGDSVGLLTFDRIVRDHFDPVGTFEGLRPLLMALEAIQPKSAGNIEAAIHQAAGLIRSRSLVLVISDLLQPPAEIVRGIRHLHHDGHDITVWHVLDRAEVRLPFAGLVEIRELESGERMVVDVDEIRQAYAREFQSYLAQLRFGCTECLADYLLVDTNTNVEEALVRRASRS